MIGMEKRGRDRRRRHVQATLTNDKMDQHQPMLLPEIEAAQALAALARGGAASCSEQPTRPEDQAVASFHENKCRMSTSALVSGKACSRNSRWNSATKLRQNLTEAEKEARRLRRILANRESARQTIRRRQAMHVELTRKAVDLSEENENLKKEKELAVEGYNSLKSRNKFLKLQMASAKAESREIQVPKSSHDENPTSATTSSPISSYNPPSLTPFFWPSVPSSNVIHFPYPTHFDFRTGEMPSLQRGPEISLGRTELQNSIFVLPLPWVLSFSSYGPVLHSCSSTESRMNETPSAHQCSMSSSSDSLFVVENKKFSSKRDGFSAIKARRRRKELMMLRNVKYHHTHSHTANFQV